MRKQIALAVMCIAAGLAAANAANAQTQALTPDFQSTEHVFPQFVDGVAAGRSYTSTLQISASEFYATTHCTLTLVSLPPTTLVDVRGVAETKTIFNFILGASGWQIFQSQGTQILKAGSAVVECTRPVTAHLIYAQAIDGNVATETTVSAAPPGRMVQFLADHRRQARFGLSIANPFSGATPYRLSVLDIDGRVVFQIFITVGYGQSFTRFLDEIANVPRDHRGLVVIETFGAADVYASGLRFTGNSFTAIPAMTRE